MPPFGVAMTFTNERVTLSYPLPQRSATSTVSSRSTSAGVMWPCSSSTGTVSVNRPEPDSRTHIGDRLVGRQVGAELADAAIEPELLLGAPPSPPRLPVTGIDHAHRKPRHEVGGLAGTLGQRAERDLRVAQEDLPVRPEPDPGARHPLGDPAHLTQARRGGERCLRTWARELARHAAPEADGVGVAAAVDLHVQPRGERVHHRSPDPVQSAGGGVGTAAELAAGVQPGHHKLHAGQAGLGFHVDRDPAPVVAHLRAAVRVRRDLDPRAVPSECLVHRVVEDLPQAVQQAPAVGGADVHARALADRVEAVEHRQVMRRIGVGAGRRSGHRRTS